MVPGSSFERSGYSQRPEVVALILCQTLRSNLLSQLSRLVSADLVGRLTCPLSFPFSLVAESGSEFFADSLRSVPAGSATGTRTGLGSLNTVLHGRRLGPTRALYGEVLVGGSIVTRFNGLRRGVSRSSPSAGPCRITRISRSTSNAASWPSSSPADRKTACDSSNAISAWSKAGTVTSSPSSPDLCPPAARPFDLRQMDACSSAAQAAPLLSPWAM
mmetsp:Transcript_34614/g.62269  ORF Transcript_34614/g.62269 Transcript_34614/m.62269 type:complete len:217 (-) Transcript_34614:3095-3745(-)